MAKAGDGQEPMNVAGRDWSACGQSCIACAIEEWYAAFASQQRWAVAEPASTIVKCPSLRICGRVGKVRPICSLAIAVVIKTIAHSVGSAGLIGGCAGDLPSVHNIAQCLEAETLVVLELRNVIDVGHDYTVTAVKRGKPTIACTVCQILREAAGAGGGEHFRAGINQLGEGVGGAQEQTVREAAVQFYIQRVIARIATVVTYRPGTAQWVNTLTGVGIDRVELIVDEQVYATGTDIGSGQHELRAQFPLNIKVPLVGLGSNDVVDNRGYSCVLGRRRIEGAKLAGKAGCAARIAGAHDADDRFADCIR